MKSQNPLSRSESRSLFDSPLAIALAEYAKLEEDGSPPGRAAFVAMHPECAEELVECLAQMDLMADFVQVVEASDRKQFLLMPDEVLGDYKIVRQVGRGGMGVVYEAIQLSLNRTVAVKVLPAIPAHDPTALARFQNEARAATLLDHPHIVNVIAVGMERGVHFYAMRFISGKTLAEILRALRPLTRSLNFVAPSTLKELAVSDLSSQTSTEQIKMPQPIFGRTHDTAGDRTLKEASVYFSKDYFRMLAELAIQGLDALEHAHQRGVIHRDIKPSNLMLDERGHLWITDFGLARIDQSESLTQPGDLIGTLRYMSPEMLISKSSSVDHRSDIYSLGATIYELATLAPIVESSDRATIMRTIMDCQPRSVRRLQGSCPRELETIILKAVAKEKEDRYSSCARMADDLHRFLQHQPILARRPTLMLRVVRWSQRNPHFAAAVVVFCMLLSLVGGISTFLVAASERRAIVERSERRLAEQAARFNSATLQSHREVSDTILAAQAWKGYNFSLLDGLLAKPEMKGNPFQLGYLRHVASNLPSILATTKAPMFCVRLSPDDSKLATAGSDGVQIWDRTTGKLLIHLKDHIGDSNGVAWSSDGNKLASVGDDGILRCYSTESWQVEMDAKVAGAMVSVDFSDTTGSIVACERPVNRGDGFVGKHSAYIWDQTDGTVRATLTGPTKDAEGLAVSNDGMFTAVASRDSYLYVWNLESQKLVHRLSLHNDSDIPIEGSCVAFAHHRPLVAVATRGNVLRVFDYHTGALINDLKDATGYEGLAFSPDDRLIVAVAAQGFARMWEYEDDEYCCITADFRHSQRLWSCAVHDDGMIYSVGQEGRIEVTNRYLPRERERIMVAANSAFNTAEFQLAMRDPIVQHQPWRAYEYASMKTRPSHRIEIRGSVSAIDQSPASEVWALGTHDGRILLFDLCRGEVLRTITLRDPTWVNCVAFSGDGQTLIAVHDSLHVTVIDGKTGDLVGEMDLPNRKSIQGVALIDEGRTILMPHTKASSNLPALRPTRVNLETMQLTIGPEADLFSQALTHPWYKKEALAYLANSQIAGLNSLTSPLDIQQLNSVSVSLDHSTLAVVKHHYLISIYRDEQWDEPIVCHGGSVPIVAIDTSPDGELVAIGTDQRIQFLHARTGRSLYEISTYQSRLNCLRFSHDGTYLVAGGQGTTGHAEIVIWRAEPSIGE